MTRVDSGLGSVELRPYNRRLSHSQMSTLHPDNQWSCPRQWSYSTLMKLPRHPSAAICVGRMLDEAATRFWIEWIEGKDFLDAVMSAESAAHQEGLASEWPSGDVGARKTAVIEAVEPLCRFLQDNCLPPSVLGMQLSHEFTVRASDGALVTVAGRSDWIEVADDQPPVVVDLKTTGTRRWDKNDVPDSDWLNRCREQVAVYRLALAATGLPDGTAVSIEGPAAIVAACIGERRKRPVFARFDFDVTQADADRVLARIVESDELARQPVHPARPGGACSFCPFVERCRSDMERLSSEDGEVAG